MDRLKALQTFLCVAETLQFREAAQRLAISPQVVTRTIAELEQTLGEALFQRSTRQVKLTDFGHRFLPHARQLLGDAEMLFAAAGLSRDEQTMSGVVRVAVSDMPMMQDVLERLWERAAPYPELSIDWRVQLALVDVVDEQIDVGIRFGNPADSRLIVRKVGAEEECVVAAPVLIERVGMPSSWEALQKGYPLSVLLNPNTGRVWPWYLNEQYQFMPARPRFVTGSLRTELAAALAGQTFSCLQRRLCEPYLASGQLVELFPGIRRKQWPACVYRPQRNVTPRRVRLVFDWLVEIMGSFYGKPGLPR